MGPPEEPDRIRDLLVESKAGNNKIIPLNYRIIKNKINLFIQAAIDTRSRKISQTAPSRGFRSASVFSQSPSVKSMKAPSFG
jgi:hypothetical protein